MAGQLIKPPVLAQPGALGVRNRQVSSADWFGPLEPLRPTAPTGTQIRQFEYLPGQNLIYRPRSTEPISFADLIFMADNCDLVRIVIEALKDEVCLKQWQVRVKTQPGETEAARSLRQRNNSKVRYWTDFLSWPNPDYCWADFLRMLLEDVFVTDAPVVLLQRTLGGKIGALRAIDGQTISRVIDDFGFTPQPPMRAYQQVLYGQPAVDLTTDDLVYRPRNPRARKLYGFSPVEQILLTLNIVLRKNRFALNFFTEGNVPEALYTMPGNVTEDNVRKFQAWFDQSLSGNLAARRRIWFIPGDDKGVQRLHFTKADALKDDSDEWFARVVCYAFRMSPMEFTKVMNRATATQSQDSSDEQGVQSVCSWVADTMNYIIQRKAGDADIEFTFEQKRESDILKQAQTDIIYVNGGINTRNEIRENKGDDPSPDPEADVLGITTSSGFVPLGQQAIANANAQRAAGGDDVEVTPEAVTPPSLEAPVKKLSTVTSRLLKKKDLRIETHEDAIAQHNVDALHTALRDFLKTAGHRSAERVTALLSGLEFVKADETKKPPTEEEVMEAAADVNWIDLVAPAEAALFGAATTGAEIAIGQLDVTDGDLISSVSPLARDFAHARAAELVGMQYRGGKLVANPNAKWQITTTTRNEIRTLVEKAFSAETRVEDLAEQIQQAGAFSETRAKSIANTEVARAQSLGTMDVWKALGNVLTTEWTVSADGPCDECRENSEADPVPLGDPYPSGDIAPPAHVNCVLAGTVVSACDRVTKQFKRWFDGEVLDIELLDGTKISITPNHPMLTSTGWIPAGHLHQGSYLLQHRDPWGLATLHPDAHLMPTMIEQVPGALLKTGRVSSVSVPKAAEDFHGDATAHGDVDIVFGTGIFAVTPPQVLGLGSDFQTSRFESSADAVAVYSDAPSQIRDRLAGEISAVEIVDIKRRRFAGHVFNLETESGYYFAGGLIIHNCRCSLTAVDIQ